MYRIVRSLLKQAVDLPAALYRISRSYGDLLPYLALLTPDHVTRATLLADTHGTGLVTKQHTHGAGLVTKQDTRGAGLVTKQHTHGAGLVTKQHTHGTGLVTKLISLRVEGLCVDLVWSSAYTFTSELRTYQTVTVDPDMRFAT